MKFFVSWSTFRDQNRNYGAEDVNLIVSFCEAVISVMQKELGSSGIADLASIRRTIKICRDLRRGYLQQRQSANWNGKKSGDSWSKAVCDYSYKPPKAKRPQPDTNSPRPPKRRCTRRLLFQNPSFA